MSPCGIHEYREHRDACPICDALRAELSMPHLTRMQKRELWLAENRRRTEERAEDNFRCRGAIRSGEVAAANAARYEYRGQRLTVSELAQLPEAVALGLTWWVIGARLKKPRRWTVEAAVNTPKLLRHQRGVRCAA